MSNAKLKAHIWAIRRGRSENFIPVEDAVADGIVAHPQEHVDALVEAGVLEPTALGNYAIVKPHVHEWRIADYRVDVGRLDRLKVVCDCGLNYLVPNRLPIEVLDA